PTIRLAAGFQIIAVNADFLAGLRIRSARCATWINADRHSRRCRYAAQIAVIVDDLSVAFPVVIQACVMPVATSGFTACVKIVTVSFDVFAALRVRQANSLIAASIACCGTTQIAVLIGNVAAALLVVVEFGLVPVSVRSLAAGFQVVTMGV